MIFHAEAFHNHKSHDIQSWDFPSYSVTVFFCLPLFPIFSEILLGFGGGYSQPGLQPIYDLLFRKTEFIPCFNDFFSSSFSLSLLKYSAHIGVSFPG
jgi:hypothetical protein